MKTFTFLQTFILLFIANLIIAQSFEEIPIPGVTNSPTSSRSAHFLDINGDGWDDIFITNGLASGEDNLLYYNNTNGTFTEVIGDDIVSDASRSVGASFADVDNDGDLDCFVVTFGSGGQPRENFFYENNGDGSFTHDPTVAPINTYSETATWIDINNDQLLDLYITNSVGNLTNLYFENQGGLLFQQDQSMAITNQSLPSRSVDWVDYDNDGDNDLFVTNEGNNTNTLYRNDGVDNFSQVNNLSIVQDVNSSAGSSWGDIDNDGDFDLFIANYSASGQANQLYINNIGDFSEDIGSVIATEIKNSFGSTFGDVDNDGDLDLLVCNAYLGGQGTNSLYMNDGQGNFIKDNSSELASFIGWTYSAAFGDYNNDGWLDVILANNFDEAQTNSLFKNTGSGNNWIKLRLTGTDSNTSAIGAIVRLTSIIDGNEVTQMRKVEASSGYCSQNSLTLHFGLKNGTTVQNVEVIWPSGNIENYSDLDSNNIYNIIEGIGLSNDEFSKQELIYYPNPVNDELFIKSISGNSLQNINSIEIYDSIGRSVYNFSSQDFSYSGQEVKVNLSMLNAGIYILYVRMNFETLFSFKVIKK